MKLFTLPLQEHPAFCEMKKAILTGKTPCMMVGLDGVHKSHFIAALSESLDQEQDEDVLNLDEDETQEKTSGRIAAPQMLIVADDEPSARRINDDINAMISPEEPISFLYPARELALREIETISSEYEQMRLNVLCKALVGKAKIIVAPIEAITEYTISPTELSARTKTIKAGQEITINGIVEILMKAGYTPRPQVDGATMFSVRGGIIDFFPPHEKMPLRIEMWGDEIDTISSFDLDSQRRIDTIKSVKITPAKEVVFEDLEILKEKLQNIANKKSKSTVQNPQIMRDIEKINGGVPINATDKYISLAYQEKACLLDYLDNPIVFTSEISACKERARAFALGFDEDIKILLEDGEIVGELSEFYLPFPELFNFIDNARVVYLETFSRTMPHMNLKSLINVNAIQNSGWSGELKLLEEDIASLLASEYTCIVLAGTEKAAVTLADDLRGDGIKAQFVTDIPPNYHKNMVYVTSGNLSAGFDYPDIKLSLVTNTRTKNTKVKGIKKRKGEEIKSLSDLAVGDLVVHVSHGIGVFDGIDKLDLDGIVKDYIKIKYAGADVLFVPVTQLDLVSKYIGPQNDGKAKLNRLNSGEWQKTRSRVKQAVAEMADELIKLYATRMSEKGHAFPADDEWQSQFESHFPFEETDDQLSCAKEIKEDMQRNVPMDRLLCADVGFGKTEVALRAAFKCATDSKQCAILCPTTILAWQHYQNMQKRFEGFPINIELLSRFRSPKQQKETIRGVKNGTVDIVVGTHRLIQKDIIFKDLGLAIVDEEQRFGVRHKERFKELFNSVDMLTLSATPIPRTLNMAMSGIRDMSTIEDPPGDRYPVQSYVLEYDRGIITEAIAKELRRGGQVYYVHNRIDSIELCAMKIKETLPEARIGIAHGKMNEEMLSEVWQKLVDKEIDILVCTTLIETGVDIANCNTLIIEDSDNMGLAQLYQLRGRIGRSNRRAYAYFTFKRGKALTEVATKRLTAIREFTKFGSGFRIALRDLEIRGAGSILGGRQHGHMEAVGYDMYIRLLNDAIKEQRGETLPDSTAECLVDLPLTAHIPESYIPNLSQRIDVYRKIASVKTTDDCMEVLDELIDRFGEPSESVKGLLDVAMLRNAAATLGFCEITQKQGNVVFIPERLNMEHSLKLTEQLKGRVTINAGAKPHIAVKMSDKNDPMSTINRVIEILQTKV